MYFCPYCGNRLNQPSHFCPWCGRNIAAAARQWAGAPENWNCGPFSGSQGREPWQVRPHYPVQSSAAPKVLGILGLFLAFLFPLSAWCCATIGLVLADREVQRGLGGKGWRTVNIVALVLSGIVLLAIYIQWLQL